MDFSWLGGLFDNFLHLFNPLKAIKHWRIWEEVWKLYIKLKAWRDWYRDHILKREQMMQELQRKIFDTFFKPIITIVDDIRRFSGVVGVFNKGLASRLNLMFLRVEGYLLLPMNTGFSRINMLGGIFGGFLTRLGYLDRATMLNSIWRDFGLLRGILYNPFGGVIGGISTTPGPEFDVMTGWISDYLGGQQSPIGASVDGQYTDLLNFLGEKAS